MRLNMKSKERRALEPFIRIVRLALLQVVYVKGWHILDRVVDSHATHDVQIREV
jgi:hypothetical protein